MKNRRDRVFLSTVEYNFDPIQVIPVISSINFNSPRNNFTDNSTLFTFSTFSKINLPTNFDVSKLTFKVTYDNALIPSENNLYYEITSQDGYISNEQYNYLMDFSLQIPDGEHTIYLTAYYDNISVAVGQVTVNHLTGFIDENGDKLDDRTGRTDNNVPVTSKNDLSGFPTFPTGSLNPIDYIVYIFDLIKALITMLFDFITIIFAGISKITALLSMAFNFFPTPIPQLFVIAIIVAIFCMFRR